MTTQPSKISNDALQLYQEVLLKHHKTPTGFEVEINNTHSADGVNAACGDEIVVYAQVEAGTITALGFSGDSCAICRASASIMCSYLTNVEVDQVEAIIEHTISIINSTHTDELICAEVLQPLLAVGKFPVRRQCAILPWRTFVKAVLES
ncbi:iron-sulfur cluster assembly scaffold protein [Thalassotalea profundi]|uniref:Iron-sulfur cluster assembly scaffold protein n=1 Tax=Thalassotalea profundi TaxID=2036687 RepID=A0ABQ3ISI7_9GAMM|nr:iron-sulfur cluster assembly scaffold protein [Thalassotalea profundi]GHE92213.1 iron-sulfur cluster assembly scaffold protein [Thalassotalea profundi]